MQEKEQKVSPIKQRILSFADSLGISKRDFYAKIGVSRGTLESKTGITEDVVAKFIATYPDVDIEWLMTGREKHFASKQEKNDFSSDFDEDTPVATQTYNPQEGIPLIPLEAMAGHLTAEQTVLVYDCDRYIIPMFKGADYLIPIKGTSMTPRYNSGDVVACQRVPMSDLFFQWNKVYVVDTNQGPLIKRIKPGSDKDHIKFVSENTEYDPFELPMSSIHGVALVIGVIRLE